MPESEAITAIINSAPAVIPAVLQTVLDNPETETGKRGKGRPALLAGHRLKTLCTLLMAGNYIETAARLAGIYPQVVHKAIERGRMPNSKARNRHIADAIEAALAIAESRAVHNLMTGGAEWRASLSYLERRNHKRWGRKDTLNIDAKIKAIRDVSDGELREMAAQAAITLKRGPDGFSMDAE